MNKTLVQFSLILLGCSFSALLAAAGAATGIAALAWRHDVGRR
jgi:hypothetical protein